MENNKAWIIAGASTIVSALGLLVIPLILLLAANLTDYATGIMASYSIGKQITSDESRKGIFKKVSMYMLVVVGFILDIILVYATSSIGIDFMIPNIIACTVAVWLVLNELISITENCLALGIEVPFLVPLLKLVKGKVEITNTKEEN